MEKVLLILKYLSFQRPKVLWVYDQTSPDIINNVFTFLWTSLCVVTLLYKGPRNVWQVWHAKQEMLTPWAPDLAFFWGFTLLHGSDFFNRFCLCPLDFMLLGYRISEFVLLWILAVNTKKVVLLVKLNFTPKSLDFNLDMPTFHYYIT